LNNLKILIIEDEQLNAENLIYLLKQYYNNFEILEVQKSIRALKFFFDTNQIFDLVFCDIELTDGNIFKFLTETSFDVPIIFTTAYDKFYQEAFDNNGIAYLLKPIRFEKLSLAIDKFKSLQNNFKKNESHLWEKIIEKFNIDTKKYKERFVVKKETGLKLIDAESIVCILYDSGRAVLVDYKGEEHDIKESLLVLEEQLNPTLFFKINRSEIVNISYIETINTFINDRLEIKMKGYPNTLTTSAARTAEFRKWLQG
jgi:DNA-binding LytR/AlgR family response regulator